MSQAQTISSSIERILSYIEEQVERYSSAYGLSAGKAFMLWYGTEAMGLTEDVAYEAAAYDGGNDKSIDFFHVDDDNQRVVIAQGKYAKQGKYGASTGEFFELIHTTDWLQNPESFEREGRSDLAEAARSYNEAIAKGYAVDFHYVYMGNAHRDVADASANFNNTHLGDVPGRTSRVVHLGALRQIHEEYINAATRIGTATVQLTPEQAFEQQGAYGRSLTATVPGTELQKLYNDHGDSLFDRNVRVFLGTRSGSVNAGIRNTLGSADRRNFWAYNNGITFICDRYEYDNKTGKLNLHNFSIVNGCQTTVSVARGPNPSPPEVSIMARFIAASDDKVVDSIIRFTNSQTPIRMWDIASQDAIQRRLKREFAEDPHPFFYELRRGETGHLSSEDKRRYTRRNKFHVIRPDELAQALAAFSGLPVEAYRYKASLFTTHRDTVFPSDIRIEQAIIAWLAGDVAQEAVKAAIVVSQEPDEAQRLLVLRRGAKLFTVAVMSVILAERNGATYLNRLTRDAAGSQANRQRLLKYAALSLEWYLQAMEDLIEGGADLNVLIRNQDTFGKVRRKVLAKWKVQSMDGSWVENALPRIGG